MRNLIIRRIIVSKWPVVKLNWQIRVKLGSSENIYKWGRAKIEERRRRGVFF